MRAEPRIGRGRIGRGEQSRGGKDPEAGRSAGEKDKRDVRTNRYCGSRSTGVPDKSRVTVAVVHPPTLLAAVAAAAAAAVAAAAAARRWERAPGVDPSWDPCRQF